VSNALVNNKYKKTDQIVHKDSTSITLIVRGASGDLEGEGELAQNQGENHQTNNILYKIVRFVTKIDTKRKIVQINTTRTMMNQP
jgi:hypothetical protein